MEMKDITGFEGLYAIASDGGVFSYITNKWLKGVKVRGYLHVCLYKDGIAYQKQVHRLVAEAFLPNPLNLPCVNHKDEDKTNNSVENLEWCDADYNSNYGTRNKRMIETRNTKNPNGECYKKTVKARTLKGCSNAEKPVNAYTLDGKFIKRFASVAEAARETKCIRGAIQRVCNGKLHKTGNMFFEYAL